MITQKMKILVVGLMILISGGIIGLSFYDGGIVQPDTVVIGGMEIDTTISELADISDIIIRGTVIQSTENTRMIPESEPPPESTRPQVERYMTVESHQIEVAEYLKGSGSTIITVFQSKSPNGITPKDKPKLTKDAELVLFLFSTEGSSFWGDGYIIQGPTQGYWNVKDENIIGFSSSIIMPLTEFRKQISLQVK